MGGEEYPLRELADVMRELTDGTGNIQFVVDKAKNTSILELGPEQRVTLVLHAFAMFM